MKGRIALDMLIVLSFIIHDVTLDQLFVKAMLKWYPVHCYSASAEQPLAHPKYIILLLLNSKRRRALSHS